MKNVRNLISHKAFIFVDYHEMKCCLSKLKSKLIKLKENFFVGCLIETFISWNINISRSGVKLADDEEKKVFFGRELIYLLAMLFVITVHDYNIQRDLITTTIEKRLLARHNEQLKQYL